ncbi:hypothetical protein T07_8150 [Trichinella nelsoni]|uniref:Uncharacterized protein n=1 Tax=Trichinella nelsoni TaxID=6336 RepID=A0A0V0S3E5_9BILA|nr:hypothetical protein T07_8150 [Trichinella nelsoni]
MCHFSSSSSYSEIQLPMEMIFFIIPTYIIVVSLFLAMQHLENSAQITDYLFCRLEISLLLYDAG